MENRYKLIAFTQRGAIPFDVVSDADNFNIVVATALDEAGTVLLDLADGGSLILTAINTVAIAVYRVSEEDTAREESENNPPRLVKL